MSFSQDVKLEMGEIVPRARHCQIAELAGLCMLLGESGADEAGTPYFQLQTEKSNVARICFTLVRKTCKIAADVLISNSTHSTVYLIRLGGGWAEELFRMLKLSETGDFFSPMLTENSCCRRSFIRGAFLAAGSMNDPRRSYHFEIVCNTEGQACFLMELINSFGLSSRMVSRRRYFVVYLKEGDQIVDMLGIMEARQALMDMENTRIVREMRGAVNRRVNCETANIKKTVNSAVRQIKDIEYIRDNGGMKRLSPQLREMAEVRLDYPHMTLEELGKHLTKPVGKSGVNHRLRRLGEIADDMRRSVNHETENGECSNEGGRGQASDSCTGPDGQPI